MTRSYCTYYHIYIFLMIIWLHNTPSTFTLRIEQDHWKIEHSLHDFMVKRNARTLSLMNVFTLGKRLVRKFSICNLSVPQKLNLCKRALFEEDEFVKEFKTYHCKEQKFQYTFNFDDVKTDPEISMYQCPNLLRRQPQTGSLIPDNRQLYISRISTGIKQAMVYKREYEGGVLIPARHLLDITKSDLYTEPPLSQEIRSKNRFIDTPGGSANSSPLFTTAPNSPSQISSTGTSLQMSPAHSSNAAQPPGRSILSSITPSIFFGPLAQIPQNVGKRTKHRRKKSTPASSPSHRESRPAALASGSVISTPDSTPSSSPVQAGAKIKTNTHRRRPPPGVILSDTINPSRPSGASTTSQSTNGSNVTDIFEQERLDSSRFAGVISKRDSTEKSKLETAADVDKRTGDIRTGEIGIVKASEWETEPIKSGIPPGHPKQTYKHKSLNRDRAYHSESSSPPDEDAEFPGFQTPAPVETSLASFIGDSPPPGSALYPSKFHDVLGTQGDQNVSYPIWPKRQKDSTEHTKEDSVNNTSVSISPNKSISTIPHKAKDSESNKLQKQSQKTIGSGVGKKHASEISAPEEVDKAEEDTSDDTIQSKNNLSLNEANFLDAYDKNVKRHNTNEPTVLSNSWSDQEKFSEETLAGWVNTSASGSHQQSDLSGERNKLTKENEPEKDPSGTFIPTATTII